MVIYKPQCHKIGYSCTLKSNRTQMNKCNQTWGWKLKSHHAQWRNWKCQLNRTHCNPWYVFKQGMHQRYVDWTTPGLTIQFRLGSHSTYTHDNILIWWHSRNHQISTCMKNTYRACYSFSISIHGITVLWNLNSTQISSLCILRWLSS